jgi:hypothetical protein
MEGQEMQSVAIVDETNQGYNPEFLEEFGAIEAAVESYLLQAENQALKDQITSGEYKLVGWGAFWTESGELLEHANSIKEMQDYIDSRSDYAALHIEPLYIKKSSRNLKKTA